MNTAKKAVVIAPLSTYDKRSVEFINGLINKSHNEWAMTFLFVSFSKDEGATLPDDPRIHLVKRDGGSIKDLYIKAYTYAGNDLSADVIIECDTGLTDLSTNLENLLAEMDKGEHYVIASRFINKGRFSKKTGALKKMMIAMGSVLTRFFLFFPFKSLKTATDPLSGIKAFRLRTTRGNVDHTRIKCKGSGFRLDLLFRFLIDGHTVTEVPFVPHDESVAVGIPGLNPLIVFFNIIIIRLNDPRTQQFLKFATVGFIGWMINASFLEIFERTGVAGFVAGGFNWLDMVPGLKIFAISETWAAALSVEMSIISNFILNNFWTFSKDKIKGVLTVIRKFLLFNITSFGAIVIQAIVMGISTIIFGKGALIRQLTLVFSIAFLVIPYNWLIYNTLIWKKKKHME